MAYKNLKSPSEKEHIRYIVGCLFGAKYDNGKVIVPSHHRSKEEK